MPRLHKAWCSGDGGGTLHSATRVQNDEGCRGGATTRDQRTSIHVFRPQHLQNAQQSAEGLEYWPRAANEISTGSSPARLERLQRIELAQDLGTGSWLIRTDAEQVLRAMQKTTDRQKTLAAHGELASDPRLPIEVINWRETPLEGRVLVHGRDEESGKRY